MHAQKKIVVIGGTGLIGSRVVAALRDAGHEVVAAAPRTGVDTVTGEGLAAAMAGTDTVIDVSNVPAMDFDTVDAFFEASGRNLVAAETAARVRHHVVLSIVGADRLPGNGYMRAKVAQEDRVRRSGLPHTVVRATQFFEFVPTLADAWTAHGEVRVPDTLFQPIAADDVAAALVRIALATPVNGVVEVAGPERVPMVLMIRRYLQARGDARSARTDPHATYFGADSGHAGLVPSTPDALGAVGFDAWLGRSAIAA